MLACYSQQLGANILDHLWPNAKLTLTATHHMLIWVQQKHSNGRFQNLHRLSGILTHKKTWQYQYQSMDWQHVEWQYTWWPVTGCATATMLQSLHGTVAPRHCQELDSDGGGKHIIGPIQQAQKPAL